MNHSRMLLALLCIILISGCIDDPKKAPKAVFDMGHGEIFSPDNRQFGENIVAWFKE